MDQLFHYDRAHYGAHVRNLSHAHKDGATPIKAASNISTFQRNMSKQEQRAFSVIVFRERSYEVSLESQNDKMIVQVQDETTTDQWRGSFDARRECVHGWKCLNFSLTPSLSPVVDIEELTRKTGNFKQFRVFINMLESAIKKVGLSIHVC